MGDSSSSDDGTPLAKLKTKKVEKSKPIVEDSSSDDDDEDDVPLAVMKKRKIDAVKKSGSKTKDSSTASSPAKKKAKTSQSSGSSATRNIPDRFGWSRIMALPVIDTSYPLKPQLVNHVLRRWNYCGIVWPPKSVIEAEPKSANYRKLMGFPGVFVGVKGSVLGVINDTRPMKGRPCYSQFILKSSQELRDLWKIGVEAQMADLIKHEGDDSLMLPLLKEELVICNKLSESKLVAADKENDKLTKKAK